MQIMQPFFSTSRWVTTYKHESSSKGRAFKWKKKGGEKKVHIQFRNARYAVFLLLTQATFHNTPFITPFTLMTILWFTPWILLYITPIRKKQKKNHKHGKKRKWAIFALHHCNELWSDYKNFKKKIQKPWKIIIIKQGKHRKHTILQRFTGRESSAIFEAPSLSLAVLSDDLAILTQGFLLLW